MRINTSLMIAIGVLAAIATAADRFDNQVRNDFFKGFTGNDEALDRGLKTCEELLAKDPKNAEALVWHGSGLFYRSGVFFRKQDFQSAMPLYDRGLKEMDQAVALAPDDIGVRIPRGATLLTAARSFPDPDRARPLFERAATDYQYAYDRQVSNLDKLGDHPRGELLMGLADVYSRLGDNDKARGYFEKLLAMGKASGHEDEAREWLAKKKLSNPVVCVGCHVQ